MTSSSTLINKKWIASIDMYRKIPGDLLEGTKRGSIISITAIIIMTTLFTLETSSFFSSTIVTDLSLDITNKDPRIPLNFNITLMELQCDYATIDVVSMLGTMQNVTKNVNKRTIDAEGVKRRFRGRNLHQHDLLLKDDSVEEQTLEEIVEAKEGVHDAVSLDRESLEVAKRENTFLFVDFFAMWCSHCRMLMPTWEKLAEVMILTAEQRMEHLHGEEISQTMRQLDDYKAALKVQLPVQIAKIDCVQNEVLCMENDIYAYPTLRLYINGKPYGTDYRGDRTIIAFTSYLTAMEKQYNTETTTTKKTTSSLDAAHQIATDRIESRTDGAFHHLLYRAQDVTDNFYSGSRQADEDHRGCELSGMLLVGRAPGNFHIEARSRSHHIVPSMMNLSHEVHHLSFGYPDYAGDDEEAIVPKGFATSSHPMDGNVYVTEALHTAYHHHLKVIATRFKTTRNDDVHRAYQMLLQSHLSHYDKEDVPEAKFTFDLSPIAVFYRQTSRRWYDYLTSVMAIVGGAFTVLGLLDAGISKVTSQRRYVVGNKHYRTEKLNFS